MAVSIRLSVDLEARLNKLANLTGRTKAFYIREAIADHIEDLEDLYLAEQRYSGIQSGASKTVPLSDVLADYGLAD